MKKYRLNLEIDGRTRDRLRKLKVDSESSSISSTIRRALALLEWGLAADADGEVIHRRSDGTVTVVKFL